jgi:flavorubredoxin
MKKKAVIVYDTMWGSTRKMAYSISEGLMKEKVEVHLHELRKSDIANILHEILEAKAVIVGSPTINGSLFPSVSSFLSYVGGLRPIGKIWASFGSYGWGGGAARDINERFTKFRFEIAGDSLQIQFTPNQDELGKCRDFGVKIARKITHSLDYS